MGGVFFSRLLREPWKNVPKNNQKNLDFVKSYHPRNKEFKHLRILLHGPVGAGKSSLINSVDSVLQGRLVIRASADAISGSSHTKQYKTYKIEKDPGIPCSFIFNDTMGFEENTGNGVHVEDIKLVLAGHVKEGYKFNPASVMTVNDPHYISSPTMDDKVHVLVSVFPADTVSLMSDEVVRKMREVRLAACDLGIPQVAILTKVDKACPEVKKDVKNAYRSIKLRKQVDEISQSLGVQPNCSFLLKNYESEDLNDDMSTLILFALRQIINFGEDFLNDQ